MTSFKKTRFIKGMVIILSVFLVFCTLSMVTTKLVYDKIFTRYDTEPLDTPKALAGIVSSRVEKQYFSGGNKLTGYLYEPKRDTSLDGLIVIAPGFHSDAERYLWQIKNLLDYGWAVFIFDMTGSGASEGDSAIGFAQAVRDVTATLNYLQTENRFGYQKLILFGHSRGAYAACCALEETKDIAAVVSVSGVNSAMEGVMGSSVEAVGSIAYGNYGFLWLYQTMLFGAKLTNLSADEVISKCQIPVLVVHGSKDVDVPIDRYSIISHKDDINSEKVKYLICDEPNQNGHTDLLFESDGTANQKLMADIHNFLIEAIN